MLLIRHLAKCNIHDIQTLIGAVWELSDWQLCRVHIHVELGCSAHQTLVHQFLKEVLTQLTI